MEYSRVYGIILINEADQVERWRTHFKQILNNVEQNILGDSDNLTVEVADSLNINIHSINKNEIKKAIKATKSSKATGSDNINAEMLKVDLDLSADILYPLFQDIWVKEQIPKEWGKGVIIKIPKKVI